MVAYSKGMPIGTPAPAFSLPGTDGATYTLASFADATLLVVIFTCNHCPYARALEARLDAVAKDYASQGVRVVGIHSNDERAYPEDAFARVKERVAAGEFAYPQLDDATQQVARAYDAACTPDIFVFDAERRLRYNGRCDDNWKEPEKVTRQDLRRALDRLLAGQAVDFDVHPALGCSIKWKPA
ncbi:MAG TPA: thioredoxin family protein [Polyangiales bacterium]|jgi:peroxiredoxin|nr:thioredoxin family protein [Polyangiales bacterium]